MVFNDKGDEWRFDGDGEFTAANLKSFLRQKTGVYLPLAGCIESMDLLAAKMVEAGADADGLVKEAEAEAAKVPEKNKRRADIYVKIMRKIAAEGTGFAEKEAARTKKLLEGKITEAKKTELQEKLNILRSFAAQQQSDGDKSKKEEL